MLKKVKLLQTFFPPVRLRAQSADIWLLVKENDQSGRSWQDKNKESEERLGQGWARKKKDGMRRLRGGEGGGKTRWQGGGNREIEEGKKCIHRCGGILTFLKSLNLESVLRCTVDACTCLHVLRHLAFVHLAKSQMFRSALDFILIFPPRMSRHEKRGSWGMPRGNSSSSHASKPTKSCCCSEAPFLSKRKEINQTVLC